MLLIDEYKDYLEGVEGKSSGTIEQYYNSVKLFMNYMKESEFSVTRQNVSKVKVSNIYGFINSLVKSNSNGSRRNKISALKSFFEYCKDMELIKRNIIKDVKRQPPKDKRVPKYFTLEECKVLVNSVCGRNKVRDRMMIIVFLNTGLRLDELTKLNVECINENSLTVIGKGNKERSIHLDSSIIESLKDYLTTRKKVDTNALFLSERLNRISGSTVENAVNKAIKAAGLNIECKKDVSVHVLRHTFATLQFQNGVSMRTLQKILGHEDISTTQIYVQVADDQMIEAARTNPLKSII